MIGAWDAMLSPARSLGRFLVAKFSISSATRQFIRKAWKSQQNIPWDFLHAFIYARWPYQYIALANSDHGLIQLVKSTHLWKKISSKKKLAKPVSLVAGKATGTTADYYHGKVMPVENAQNLLRVNESVRLPDLEQVIPYHRARALILETPGHILKVECPCRMAKKSPCQPVDVCLIVGEPFTTMIYQHYPSRAQWISPHEACEIIGREDARGRVHHAFFSEMMLGRFFAVCNCCSCCCTAMKAHQRGTPMLASSGYLAKIEQDLCTACFECEPFCHFGAISKTLDSIIIDPGACMGCGICTSKCPMNAITLHLEPAKGIPLEISTLIESV